MKLGIQASLIRSITVEPDRMYFFCDFNSVLNAVKINILPHLQVTWEVKGTKLRVLFEPYNINFDSLAERNCIDTFLNCLLKRVGYDDVLDI